MALIFFDIDGTLYNDSTGFMPDSVTKALKMAQANGHKIFINSGRTICRMPHPIEPIKFDGYVCGCGTYIEYDGEVLLHHPVSEKNSKRFVKKMVELGIDGFAEGTEDIYFPVGWKPWAEIEHVREDMYGRGMGKKKDFETGDYSYDKLLAFVDDEAKREELFKEIEEELYPIDRFGGMYECIQKGYSKSIAIDFLREYFHCDLDDIYVFGDGPNDIPMLEYAKHSIIMGDHSPVIEEYAEYITDTIEEDGIYNAMVHYGLI